MKVEDAKLVGMQGSCCLVFDIPAYPTRTQRADIDRLYILTDFFILAQVGNSRNQT